jgi:hypothetical protein
LRQASSGEQIVKDGLDSGSESLLFGAFQNAETAEVFNLALPRLQAGFTFIDQ